MQLDSPELVPLTAMAEGTNKRTNIYLLFASSRKVLLIKTLLMYSNFFKFFVEFFPIKIQPCIQSCSISSTCQGNVCLKLYQLPPYTFELCLFNFCACFLLRHASTNHTVLTYDNDYLIQPLVVCPILPPLARQDHGSTVCHSMSLYFLQSFSTADLQTPLQDKPVLWPAAMPDNWHGELVGEGRARRSMNSEKDSFKSKL